jgi:IclR family transcriptional regulator, acetate operon repressor
MTGPRLDRRGPVSNIRKIVKRHSKSVSVRQVAGTQAVGRALRILHAFADGRPEWTLADLSRELGLSKPTAFRLLLALEHEGLVVRHDTLHTYRLGPAAIELGARAQRANSVTSAARPELETLTRATGETSSVEILAGDDTLILDEVQGGHLIGTSPSVGTRWPAHATSTGKVLLAAALEEDRDLVRRMARGTGGRLRGMTPCTIRSASRLISELSRVSRQGYATAVGELEVGYVAIGAPVRRHDGRVLAAISLGGPSTRFTDARLPGLIRAVREAGGRISQRLGWVPGAASTQARRSAS